MSSLIGTAVMNPAVIALVISGLAFLFGPGIIILVIKHSNETAVLRAQHVTLQEQVRKNTDEISDLKTKLALMNQTVERIDRKMSVLDLVPAMNDKLSQLVHLQDVILPRPEAEVRFRHVEEEIQHVKEEIAKS